MDRSYRNRLGVPLLLGLLLCWGSFAEASRKADRKLRVKARSVKVPLTQKQLDVRLKPIARIATRVQGFFNNGKIFRGKSESRGLGALSSITRWWPIVLGFGIKVGKATNSQGKARYFLDVHGEGGGLGYGGAVGRVESVDRLKPGTPIKEIMPIASIERTVGKGRVLFYGSAQHEVVNSPDSTMPKGLHTLVGLGLMLHGGKLKGINFGQLLRMNLSPSLPLNFTSSALRNANKASHQAALAHDAMQHGRPEAAERHLLSAETAIRKMKTRLSSRDRSKSE